MVGRLQRFLVFGLLTVAVAVFGLFALAGMPWYGLLAAIFTLGGYAVVLAFEFVCLVRVEKPVSRPALADLWYAWLIESVTAARVFGWHQPFRSDSVSDDLPEIPDGRRGLLLVHGLVCNRGFWIPWLYRLQRLGLPFLAINMEPVFGAIESYSDAIERAVVRLTAATGMSPVIVAHSMGGLAVRYWLLERSAADRVHRIITIGTPHGGTWLARFGASRNARQMRIGSDWLEALSAAERNSGNGSFTCFYGSCDNVVFPSEQARLPGADNRHIDCYGHVALAFREQVFAEALHWLEAAALPDHR